MRILITGSAGFIGKNLFFHLKNSKDYKVITFHRGDKLKDLKDKVQNSDIIVHLAGENRPKKKSLYIKGNVNFTKKLCDYISLVDKKIPVLFSSSIKVHDKSAYGQSKLEAETLFKDLNKKFKNPIYIFRLPNIFGKWSKPNYNSVVSTFCYNITNNLPVKINDNKEIIGLSYIDDVISSFMSILKKKTHKKTVNWPEIKTIYNISIGDLANKILDFKLNRKKYFINNVGNGLNRALYSTFMSYAGPDNFAISVPKHEDNRGIFVEMLKTPDSGQFSFFTLKPGLTRGGHYHNTKTEKFFIVSGKAKFSFKNIVTQESVQILSNANTPKIIDTIPGWAHSVKNIGSQMLIGVIWANEIFDKKNSDTIMMNL